MLNKFLLVAIFALPTCLFAQQKIKLKNPETVIGQVLYNFTYISDTTQPDKPQKEIVVLDFSNNYSKFYSQTFNTSVAASKADMDKQLQEQQGSANLTLTVHSPEGTADVFLTDKKEEKVEQQQSIFSDLYLISNGKHTINWDIQDSTKTIGGYTCQKAVGTSRGREYVAWFTTDLPYSFGPRRLNGLPGLILEAYDITNRIVYTFKQYNTISGKEIGIPEQGIASTEKEYDDMQAAFKADPNSYQPSSPPPLPPAGAKGSGDISKIKSINIFKSSSSGDKTKRVVNFPIDLNKDE
jgi:GLPGLI family protein